MQYLFTDHPEFAKVPVARVIEDHMKLKGGSVFFYDRQANPLHWTQMQEVAKFAESAAKVFGKEAALSGRRETTEEYVLRMLALAHASGKVIPGVSMVK